jgi:hypothetical protein
MAYAVSAQKGSCGKSKIKQTLVGNSTCQFLKDSASRFNDDLLNQHSLGR